MSIQDKVSKRIVLFFIVFTLIIGNMFGGLSSNATSDLDSPLVASISAGITEATTSIVLENYVPTNTYYVAFSDDDQNVPDNSTFVLVNNLTSIAVKREGDNRYLFLKAQDTNEVDSEVSEPIDLTGCVKPFNIPTGNITLVTNANQPAQSTDYYSLLIWTNVAGIYDVGCASSADGTGIFWTKLGVVQSGTNSTRAPFYLAHNASRGAMRVSADGVIPASGPKFANVDLNTASAQVAAGRYINPPALGKFEFEDANNGSLKFKDTTTFLPYMKYVVWVEGNLSGDTAATSTSKYAHVGVASKLHN